MACRALASGEVNGAVVGGTNMILDAAVQMSVDKMGVLSHSTYILPIKFPNSRLTREPQPQPAILSTPQPTDMVGLKVLGRCT